VVVPTVVVVLMSREMSDPHFSQHGLGERTTHVINAATSLNEREASKGTG